MKSIFVIQVIVATAQFAISPINYGTKTATIQGRFTMVESDVDITDHTELIENIALLNGEISFTPLVDAVLFDLDIVIDASLSTSRNR